MKVLLIDVYFYHKGGVESVFFNTAELLKKKGHEVIYFSLKWEENYPYKYDNLFAFSKQTRKGFLSTIINLKNYFYYNQAAINLKKLIELEKPDIAHVHLFWGQLSPSIFSVLKKFKIPLIHTVHDYRIVCPAYCFRNDKVGVCEECKGKKFYKCFFNRCSNGNLLMSLVMSVEMYFRNIFFNPVKNIDGLIYVSKFSHSIHEKYMPLLSTIPSINLYNSSNEIIDFPDHVKFNKYFLYFGRLSHEKGLKTLIETFKILPHIKLKIVGTGPLENELIEFTNSNKLFNIEFLGYKTGEELKSIVAKSYFVLVPSEWYENNPMTIIESYSLGVPVIGARIGGIPEIIVDGVTGYLFESENVEDLKAKVSYAFQLSDKNYSGLTLSALEFARRNFSSNTYFEKLIAFYNKIIKEVSK